MAFQQKVLKECSKILLEIENAKNPEHRLEANEFEQILSQRFVKYKQRKQSNDEESLPLHEFVALCSITADRSSDKPFLFEKTKLSFTIMCSNCDVNHEPMINLKQFEKWATKLYPLATKQNYKRIFLALASDSDSDHGDDTEQDHKTSDDGDVRRGSFGRLRQKMAEFTSGSNSSLEKLNTSKHDKSVYGGITMQRFCGYVEELKTNYDIEQNECQGIKISLESHLRSMSERILYHIRGVSDMTGLPPYYGFVILTDYHLIFQGTALTTRTTCIKLSDAKLEIGRAKIGGFLKRDTALRVCCSSGTFTWNVVQIKSLRRDQLYWSIWSMVRAHELASNVKRILNENDSAIGDDALLQKMKRRIIVEAADDVLRQNALQNLMLVDTKNALKFDAIPFVRFATLCEKKRYVLKIRNELNEIELATHHRHTSTQKSGMTLSSIFTPIAGMIHTPVSHAHDSRDRDDSYIDPLLAMESRKYSKLQSDFERDSKLEKLNQIQREKREEFDLREFFKYLKILRIQFEPLLFMHRLYLCVILWKNKGFSMFVLLCLELAAYCNVIQYIPALLFIANGILLISMRNDMEYTIACADSALIFAGYDADDFDQEKQAALKYAQKYKNLDEKPKGWKWSIMHKIKSARYKFYYNRFSMGFHQKKLARLSVWIGRWRTIYKWHKVDKSQTACLVSIAIGVALMVASARYVFAIVVAALFFKDSPFRSDKAKKKKGAFSAYFEGIPPDIPHVDSEEDEEEEYEEEDEETAIDAYEESNTDSNEENNSNNKMKRIKKQMMNKMKKTMSASSIHSAASASSTSADDTDT